MKQLTNYFDPDNFLKGNLGMEIVKAMLKKSGYTVCHYGYEYTMLDALSKRTFKKSNSATGRRIRSSPDLLVYDTENTIMFVEVKSRGKTRWVQAGDVWINKYELDPLKEFWSDSILVIVVPEGIYAQRKSELEIQQNGQQRLSDFKKFQEIFTKVRSEDISHYEEIALQIFEIFTANKEKPLKDAPSPCQLEMEPNISNAK